MKKRIILRIIIVLLLFTIIIYAGLIVETNNPNANYNKITKEMINRAFMNKKYTDNDRRIIKKSIWDELCIVLGARDESFFPRTLSELYVEGININPINKKSHIDISYDYGQGSGEFSLYYKITDKEIYYYKIKYREGEAYIIAD